MTFIKTTRFTLQTLNFLILILLLMGTSCKKIKTTNPDPAEEEISKPEPEQPKNKVLIPVKLESTTLSLELKYRDNTGFISEIKLSNGIRYTVAYTNELPKKLDQYAGDQRTNTIDYLAAEGKVIRITAFEIQGQHDARTDKLLLTYNANGQISKIIRQDLANIPVEEETYNYGPTGLLISSATRITEQVDASYSYDTQKGIFSAVKCIQLLRIALPYPFINYGANNLVKYMEGVSEKTAVNYIYQYNIENYPAEIIVKTATTSQTFKITYAELK